MSENCSFVSIFDAHSGYLETEFQMIYSKIPITSYQKGQQESGTFRPWVVSAGSFRPGSFRPKFGRGSFRPILVGRFGPGSFRTLSRFGQFSLCGIIFQQITKVLNIN